MLDIQLIRDEPARVRAAIEAKKTGDPEIVLELLELDKRWRGFVTALQERQEQMNTASRAIGELLRDKRTEEAEEKRREVRRLKEDIKAFEENARRDESLVREKLLEIPNLPFDGNEKHARVPDPDPNGPDGNIVVFRWGEHPRFDFEPLPHWELAARHGLIDFERGAKVAGAGFPFYVGQGARLQRALVEFFLDEAVEASYTEVQPPLLVNERSAEGTGQLPDKEGQMYGSEDVMSEREAHDFYSQQIYRTIINDEFIYEIEKVFSVGTERSAHEVEKKKLLIREYIRSKTTFTVEAQGDLTKRVLFLVPTAEVPLTNYLRDEILDEATLPRLFVGYTPCFRREAGSYGKDVRGLNRLHQFDKVELVRFVHPETSYDALEELREDCERVVQKLGLPYRRLLMCTADLGFTPAKKYDLEVWSAGQERWLEVSSVSNFEAYQARRANIRFRPGGGGKPQFVHTLNGSALALPRIVAALLENGQQADGSILLPQSLVKYTGFYKIG